ncbi:methyl-accepting chemotaxis protein [Massilia sp. W12]|uniref:methyl-accepting chemotaxis protein n=1 Tax=Massilia sp. W12 TaxID=3126507 RepID=UPI0030D37B75
MFFSHWSLRAQLVSVFVFIFFGIALLGSLSLYQINTISEKTEKMYRHPFTVSVNIVSAEANLLRMYRTMDNILQTTEAAALDPLLNEINQLDQVTEQELLLVQERFLGNKQYTEDMLRSFRDWRPIRKQIIDLKREGKHDEAIQFAAQQAIAKRNEMNANEKKIRNFAVNKGKQLAEESAQSAQSTFMFMSSLVVAVLALVGGAFWFMLRRLQTQLGGDPAYAVSIVKRIASGDLACEISTAAHDNKSLLFEMQGMRDNLANIVSEVRRGADNIANAANDVARGNMDLSSRTESQAGSLEETASSMEELTATVRQNADSARQARDLAGSASDVAQRGGKVVGEVVNTMDSINASSKKIVDIISVIDGIAFQTNILALNAAVEAARAGEQGRGFAVVAAEVRSLAQRSAGAAKEIKQLINDSVEKVGAGARLVDQAGATMSEIVQSIQRVTDIISEISAASQEQSTGIEQINQAIVQMDHNTQQNSALVEEAAAATHSMQEETRQLVDLVATFTLAHSGAKAQAQMPRAAKSQTSKLKLIQAELRRA